MKSISGKHLCKILEKKGWQLKTIRGSHHVFMKTGRKERISVPVHGNKDLKTGLLRAIMEMLDFEFSYLVESNVRLERNDWI